MDSKHYLDFSKFTLEVSKGFFSCGVFTLSLIILKERYKTMKIGIEGI